MAVRPMFPDGKRPSVTLKERDNLFLLKKVTAILEENWYIAEILSVEETSSVNSASGLTPRVRITFQIEGHEQTLKNNFLLIEHPNQPFYQLIKVVTGRCENVAPEDIIGRKVGIQIRNTEKGNEIFSNVVSVCNADELEDDEEYNESHHVEEYEDNKEYDPNAYEEIEC